MASVPGELAIRSARPRPLTVRVAIVCPYDLDVPGGVQDQVIRLQGWLTHLGHDSVVVAPGGSDREGFIDVGGSLSVPVNRSRAPIALDPRVAARVRGAVDDADVIHIHEPLVPFVSFAATRIAEKPTVGTFHADASRAMRRALRAGGPIIRYATRHVDVMTAVSPVARSVVDGLGDIRIIPNGMDVEQYGGASKRAASVAYLGRDDPRKGLDVLLDAWPLVRERVPSATLAVIGARRDAGPDGVTFMGRVTEDEKRRALAVAEVYVAPNLGGESFGIVLVEAMASGCAVVASALPAFTRVLGSAGVFVKPGDASGLADAVVRVLSDGDEQRALRDAGSVRAERYDGTRVANEYVDAYEAAILARGR